MPDSLAESAAEKLQRIALVNVVLDGDYSYGQELPLGMACLGSFLRREGYPVEFHQCYASRLDEALDALDDVDADVYGVQLNMANFRAACTAVRRKPNKIPKIAVTTSSSAKVNALVVASGF